MDFADAEPLGRAAHRRFVLYDVKRRLAGALLDVPFQTATLPAMILTGHVYASEREICCAQLRLHVSGRSGAGHATGAFDDMVGQANFNGQLVTAIDSVG